jgi:hypothetical protein
MLSEFVNRVNRVTRAYQKCELRERSNKVLNECVLRESDKRMIKQDVKGFY